jgi:5-methylcytosine-specific restriction protein A
VLLLYGKMTDREAKRFYDSAAWKHKRLQILVRDHYECQDCRKRLNDAVAAGKTLNGKDRMIRRAEEVHHIQELKEHPELALEDDNLVSLCISCHNLRHGRAPKKFKRKRILASKERW